MTVLNIHIITTHGYYNTQASMIVRIHPHTDQFYSSGIYNTVRCSSYMVNHGMLVTGYGTYNDKDYWLVKNR